MFSGLVDGYKMMKSGLEVIMGKYSGIGRNIDDVRMYLSTNFPDIVFYSFRRLPSFYGTRFRVQRLIKIFYVNFWPVSGRIYNPVRGDYRQLQRIKNGR